MLSVQVFMICILLATFGPGVHADYDCLCNYQVERAMYGAPDTRGSPVGYMYEFDCKPITTLDNLSKGWTAILNEHKVAYVSIDEGGLASQICQGSVPSEDKLFTTTTSKLTSTTKPTTKQPTATSTTPNPTTKPITTPNPTTKPITTTNPTTKPTTTSKPTTKPTTPNPTTEPTSTTNPTTKPTTTSKPTTKLITKLATTPKATPKVFTTKMPTSTKHVTSTSPVVPWSTTSDWLIHWNITHAPYTTTKPHHEHGYTQHSKTTPPSFMRSTTSNWLVHWSITHAPYTTGKPHHITNHNKHTTIQHNTGNQTAHGNLQKCPRALTNAVNHNLIRQYNGHCYEIVKKWKNWYNAEMDCWNRIGHGGELLEIYSSDIQHYIMQFLRDANYVHGIWIGLQDIEREEHFKWDSGIGLTYTNWNPNRKGNRLPHGKEDCVFLQSNGQWDDSLCANMDLSKRFLMNSNNVNSRRPYICQYPTHNPHGR